MSETTPNPASVYYGMRRDDEGRPEEKPACENCWHPTTRSCERCGQRICRKCATQHKVADGSPEEFRKPCRSSSAPPDGTLRDAIDAARSGDQPGGKA